MRARTARAWTDVAQVVLLVLTGLGLFGSFEVAMLALFDRGDFDLWLWAWWVSLPFLIVTLIVGSVIANWRGRPMVALLIRSLTALPGVAVAGFLVRLSLL